MKTVLLACFAVLLAGCGDAVFSSTSPQEGPEPAPTADSATPAPIVDSGPTSQDAGVATQDAAADQDAADAGQPAQDAGDVAACQAAACAAAAQQQHPAYGGQACGVLPTTTLCGGYPVNCGDACDATFTCGDDGTTPNQCGNVCAGIYVQDCDQHNSQFPGSPVPIGVGYDGDCGAQPWLGRTCSAITTPGGASRVCCQ